MRHLALVPDTPCDHQQEAMTRHNLAKKLLTFVLVCPVCETEKVVHTVPYEPTFERPPRLAA